MVDLCTPNGSNGFDCSTASIDAPLEDSSSTTDDGGGDPNKTPPPVPENPANTDVGTITPATTIRTTPLPTVATPTGSTPSVVTIASNGSPVQTASAVPASSSGGSNGVSKGAVAGIAIATCIIGAAIAFLAAFFLFKRRNRPAERHSPYDSSPDLVSPLKGKNTPYVQVSQNAVPPPVLAAVVPPNRSSQPMNADASHIPDFLGVVLPPAADEQTVKSKVAALFNRIQQHVDSFYRDVHASITPTMETDLARFGSSESVSMVEMLRNSSMPTVAIKHALAGYILSIVSPEAEDQATLFPAEVAGIKKDEQFEESPDRLPAYILYRRLATHLHSPTPSSQQSRASDIREAAEHFALTFFPWANPACGDAEKDEDLVHIIHNALDLSVWLYGEPYLYEFVWEGVGRRGMVIAPGLVRVTDSMGKVYERPMVLLDPLVVST